MVEENQIDMKEEVGEATASYSVPIAPFDPSKKKKKKKVVIQETAEKSVDKLAENEDGNSEGIVPYEYEELLGMVFDILREHNPELVAVDRRRTVMRHPQILREGHNKTVFVDFMDYCERMHRPADHVRTFLLNELGASGSLDGRQRLVVKGGFRQHSFERILHRYMNDYVICLGCKSSDTILSKENRPFFVLCETCGSGRSVAPLKAGFVARVGRRGAGT